MENESARRQAEHARRVDAWVVHAPLYHWLLSPPVALDLLAIVQFVWLLFAREPNQFIAGFGNSLGDLASRKSDGFSPVPPRQDKPFPWKPWSGTGGLPVQLTGYAQTH